MAEPEKSKPTLLVLASTYPRWRNDPEPGFVHELSRRLTTRFRVIVLCPHAEGAQRRETLDGVEVVRYRYAPERWETLVNDGGIVNNLRRSRWRWLLVPSFVFMQTLYVWRLQRSEQVDVIHAHWLVPQGVIAALLNLLPNRVPFVVTSHGADLYALKGRFLDAVKRFVLSRAQAATVVSSAMREPLNILGVETSKIAVLPMGVDLSDRFVPDPAVRRSRNEMLFVGRLVEKKGVRFLLDALPRIHKRMPDIRLTIVGFGPQEAMLRAQVSQLGIEAIVTFRGAVPQADLPSLYQSAALFVAPFVLAESGDQEGLGLVLIEAAGCACPILVGDVPAVKDVVPEEFNEIVIDPQRTKLLSDRILELLTDYPRAEGLALRLGSSLRVRFDWARVSESYAELLHKQCDAREN